MITALKAAEYLAMKHKSLFQTDISEMKLHKLLYFAQRESIIETDSPLFSEQFEGWRFGPVLPSIRSNYNAITCSTAVFDDSLSKEVLDNTFERYGRKDAWSLSRLTHGEESWKRSRVGIPEYQNSHNMISLDNIRIDAERVKKRRTLFSITDKE